MPKPACWELAALRWWNAGDNSEVEQNEGPPVSVQGRVNKGGLGPGEVAGRGRCRP